MLSRTWMGSLLVLVLLGGSTLSLEAQPRRGPWAGGGPFVGQAVEKALENQQKLGLTRDQVSQLQELKRILDTQVTPLAEEMKTLREKIRSGQVERNEGLREMQALAGRLMEAAAPLRGRMPEILTEAQHRQLREILRAERPAGRGGLGLGPRMMRWGWGGRGGAWGPAFRGGFGWQGRWGAAIGGGPWAGRRPLGAQAPLNLRRAARLGWGIRA